MTLFMMAASTSVGRRLRRTLAVYSRSVRRAMARVAGSYYDQALPAHRWRDDLRCRVHRREHFIGM
jgi:hypothetical protein